MMRLFFLFIVLLSLNGCHYFKIRFKHTKNIEGMDSHISLSVEKDTSIQYCVITHGIGRKEYDYSYDLIEQVGKDLLGKNFQHQRKVIKVDTIKESNYLEKHTCTSQETKNKIVFYSVRWSVFTDSIKDAFINRENKPDNWTLSKQIKNGVMIERAGDLFFVQKKNVLRKIFSVYDALFRDIENSNIPDAPLTIVTASLGSQVFLRYLNHVKKRDEEKTEQVASYDKYIMNKFNLNKTQNSKEILSSDCTSWFLFSNQMDLMLEGVYRWGGETDKELNLSRIDMTVFRNPNDMLSYILPEKTKLLSDTETNIQNVHYYNAPFKNNLLSAHTQTLYLKKMHRALAFGSYNDLKNKKNWWFVEVNPKKD